MRKKFLICIGIAFLSVSQCFSQPLIDKEQTDLLFDDIPVVFAATKVSQKITDVPATVTVIQENDIKKYGYETLSEALRMVTGLYVTNDRSYEYLAVRGYYMPGDYLSRILMMINGNVVNDPIYGSAKIGRELGIPIDAIKRIEIIKGPGSALYGSNALLAVINIVTKDGYDIDGGEISTNIGSYGYYEGQFSYGKKLKNDLDFMISYSQMTEHGQDLYYTEFDSPDTNNGVFKDGDKENAKGLVTKFLYKDITLQAGLNTRDKKIPNGAWGTTFNDNRTHMDDNGNFIELRYNHNFDNKKAIISRFYKWNYKFTGDYAYNQDAEDIILQDNHNADWYGSELQFDWKLSSIHRIILGADYQYNFLKMYSDEVNNNNSTISTTMYIKKETQKWATYAQDILSLSKKFSFILGLRYDNYSEGYDVLNPRIGGIYTPWNKGKIKLLHGTAFHAPSLYESDYNDGGNTTIPNYDLKPEKLKTSEIVFEQMFPKNFDMNCSLYHTNIRNRIIQETNSDDLLQFINAGEVRAKGIELNLKKKWSNKAVAQLGYNHQESCDVNTNKEPVNSPKNSGIAALSIPVYSQKIFISPEAEYIGKRLSAGDSGIGGLVKSHFITNLTIFSAQLIKNIELTLKVKNIFNESYSDPVSSEFTQLSIPQDKRNYLLKITWRL
jgi:outer membrane receptor for ferrienterochelin and colicins